MRALALVASLSVAGAGGCAGGFGEGRVGGFFPSSIKDAKPGLGTEWHFGAIVTPDVALHAGVGAYLVKSIPTGCRPGGLSSCTGPAGQFDSDTGSAFVAPVMGGVKLMHRWGSFSPFVRAEGGLLYTEYSHGLQDDRGSAAAYRIGTGLLVGSADGKGMGIEAGLLRSGNVTYSKTVARDYRYSGLTVAFTVAF